jgi:hypothetical protein
MPIHVLPIVLIAMFAAPGASDEKTTELEAMVSKQDSEVRVKSDEEKTVLSVTSRSGIGRATIRRKSPRWPKVLVVRLHLTGLESFRITAAEKVLEWSVSSSGDHAVRVAWRTKDVERAVTDDSPLRKSLRIVGGTGEFPLKAGCFEVTLPSELLDDNPQALTLQWIDFYRG